MMRWRMSFCQTNLEACSCWCANSKLASIYHSCCCCLDCSDLPNQPFSWEAVHLGGVFCDSDCVASSCHSTRHLADCTAGRSHLGSSAATSMYQFFEIFRAWLPYARPTCPSPDLWFFQRDLLDVSNCPSSSCHSAHSSDYYLDSNSYWVTYRSFCHPCTVRRTPTHSAWFVLKVSGWDHYASFDS